MVYRWIKYKNSMLYLFHYVYNKRVYTTVYSLLWAVEYCSLYTADTNKLGSVLVA